MFFGGGGFPFGEMPGGFGGGMGGGGRPRGKVENERYYAVLGVSKDASEQDIKKVGAQSRPSATWRRRRWTRLRAATQPR